MPLLAPVTTATRPSSQPMAENNKPSRPLIAGQRPVTKTAARTSATPTVGILRQNKGLQSGRLVANLRVLETTHMSYPKVLSSITLLAALAFVAPSHAAAQGRSHGGGNGG